MELLILTGIGVSTIISIISLRTAVKSAGQNNMKKFWMCIASYYTFMFFAAVFAASDAYAIDPNDWRAIHLGHNYELDESSLRMKPIYIRRIVRDDDCRKFLKDGVSTLSVEGVVQRLYQTDLFKGHQAFPRPKDKLIVEFNGRQNTGLEISNSGSFPDLGQYLTLVVGLYQVPVSANLKVLTSSGVRVVKRVTIKTEHSSANLLQRDMLNGELSNYWKFWIQNLNWETEFKVKGVVTYAEQTLNENDSNVVEELELVVEILEVQVLP